MEPGLLSDSVPGPSHIVAPECACDGPAHIIDVSTFLSDQQDRPYITAALRVSPIEGLGNSPSQPILDSQVLYEIHILTTPDSRNETPTYSYQFRFNTRFTNQNRILQSFLGMIQEGEGMAQGFGQTYTVTRVSGQHRGKGRKTVLGTGRVSPQQSGVCELEDGHRAFVGRLNQDIDIDMPTDFLADHSPSSGNHSVKPLNPPMLVLQIPVSLFGGEHHIDGIYATKRSLNWRRLQLNQTSPVIYGRGTRYMSRAFQQQTMRQPYGRLTMKGSRS